MNKKVSKFGGTSMGNVACMRRSAEVSLQQAAYVVCVSATSGTTNLLIQLGESAGKNLNDQVHLIKEQIISKHSLMAEELNLEKDEVLFTKFKELILELNSVTQGMQLLKDCSPRALDILLSLGERLSSVLFSKALFDVQKQLGQSSKKIKLLDARDFLKTDDHFGQAKPLIELTRQKASEIITETEDQIIYVTQGFIGSTSQDHTTTLGRGGSDYSAALISEAIDSKILEIWTDVPGIATTDPRICPEAQSIAEISFQEAAEMAVFGAKVLHPSTIEPAKRKNIPVFVGSSFDPKKQGTWVRRNVDHHPLVRALALRKNQTLVTMTTPDMLQSHGFLYKIFKVFNDHQISIDAVTTSEISVSVTLDGVIEKNQKLIADLKTFADVEIESQLSLVSLIGNNINHTPGLAKTIFSSIENINVRLICLGASKHNFCFLVSQEQGESAIKQLHAQFIG